MQLYDQVSYDISQLLTTSYSSSFSASSLLFSRQIRRHIYSIYGLVRIADEIVDTYQGSDKLAQLDGLESETYAAIERGYSVNPIVHSFAKTAKQYRIDQDLIAPFFASMRIDIDPPKAFTTEQYQRYIVGSAEVVGLMCLRVFTDGDQEHYERLKVGASRLGAAYQKVNFLRDMADDYNRLSRVYFPGVDFETFDDEAKKVIEQDIEQDFRQAGQSIRLLPASSKRAVRASYTVYYQLFTELRNTPATTIKKKRIRLSNRRKTLLIAKSLAGGVR